MAQHYSISESEGEIKHASFPVKYGIIQTNMWNTNKIYGNVQIFFGRDFMRTKIEIKDVDLKQMTIFGYPEYAIGYNLMSSAFNPAATKLIHFPMTIEKFIGMDLKLYTKFSIKSFHPSELPFNISYDFWIRHDKEKKDHPEESDYEIMIWLYRQIQSPIGKIHGYTDIYCKVNGKTEILKFSIWIGRGARWLTISFVMESEKQSKDSDIEIPVSKFMELSKKYMENPDGDQWIMGIELGSEFGDKDHLKMGLDWILERYEIRDRLKVDLLDFK